MQPKSACATTAPASGPSQGQAVPPSSPPSRLARGTGRGLSSSYDSRDSTARRDTIAVYSRVGEFTEFTVRQPRSFQAAGTGAAA